MKQIVLFEDKHSHYLLPLSYFKHFSELKVGCLTIREKWERKAYTVSRSGRHYLTDNSKLNTSDTLWVSGRILPNASFIKQLEELEENSALVSDNFILAIRSKDTPELDSAGFLSDSNKQNYTCTTIEKPAMLCYPWDVMSYNHSELEEDLAYYKFQTKAYVGVHLLNEPNVYIHETAEIQPGVVINAENGPVVINEHAKIGANSYLEGPLYLSKKVEVRPFTSVKDSAIHYHCKIGGEISGSVMYDYSNKVHHGFLGNSVLGSWTNLGAGTTNSNLKNNYSNVSMMYFNDIIKTDTQFLGLIFGDHSKAAINTTFNTGTIVGVNTNIFGGGIPPKLVPSFIWGGIDSFEKYNIDKAKTVAKAVMDRRNIEFDDTVDALFNNVYQHVLDVEY